MTDDLVARVRRIGIGSELGATTRDKKTAQEAADRIEQLEAALLECANQHKAIWSLAVKEQKGETTVSPYALAQITWAANEAARAALAGEKKDD